jgi:hypothetical protein
VRFRLETGSEILASPAYLKPFVYVAAASGELFAMNEMTGARRWKYATGFPVTRAAAPVGTRVFVTSEEPALHCIDAASGNMLWESPRVAQFAAASKDRVYGVDDLGALVVLDGAKGTRVGRLVTDHAINTLVNDQTDRIYLVSDNGVIECFHELGATEPLEHNPKPAEEKAEAGEKQVPATAAPPAAQPKAPPAESSDEATPFEDQPKNPEVPADKEPEKPAGDFGVEENPFGN